MDLFLLLSLGVVVLANLSLILRDDEADMGSRVVQLIIVVIFSLIMTVRPIDSPDTANYVDTFYKSVGSLEEISSGGLFGKYQGTEYGFWFLAALFQIVFGSVEFFFFFTAFFCAFFLPHYLAKLAKAMHFPVNEPLIRTIYITGFGLLYCAAAIRSGVAMTLGIMALYYFADRKKIRTVICFMVAFWVHTTALLYLFFIFVLAVTKKTDCSNSKPSGAAVIIIAALFAICSVLFDPMQVLANAIPSFFSRMGMGEYGRSYLGEPNQGGFGLTKLLLCGCLIALVFVSDREGFKIPKFFRCIVYLTLGTIIVFANMRAASRLYDLSLVVCIPIVAKVFEVAKKENQVWAAGIFAIFQIALLLISFNTYFKFTY